MQELELHVNSLSEGRTKDKKHIQTLEKELMNCSQELGSASISTYHILVSFCEF